MYYAFRIHGPKHTICVFCNNSLIVAKQEVSSMLFLLHFGCGFVCFYCRHKYINKQKVILPVSGHVYHGI